jgi:hypothetical protein
LWGVIFRTRPVAIGNIVYAALNLCLYLFLLVIVSLVPLWFELFRGKVGGVTVFSHFLVLAMGFLLPELKTFNSWKDTIRTGSLSRK